MRRRPRPPIRGRQTISKFKGQDAVIDLADGSKIIVAVVTNRSGRTRFRPLNYMT